MLEWGVFGVSGGSLAETYATEVLCAGQSCGGEGGKEGGRKGGEGGWRRGEGGGGGVWGRLLEKNVVVEVERDFLGCGCWGGAVVVVAAVLIVMCC